MNPDSTVDPRSPHGGTNGDSHAGSTVAPTVTPAEYARLTGLHVRTVRERIRRGELPAVQVKGRHGPEYRIPHPDSIPAPTVSVTVDLPSITSDNYGAPTVDPPFLSGDPVEGLGELVALVDRLSRENLELAGRLGFYQAQIQHLQGENADLKERIALLEAPKPGPADPVPTSTANHPAPEQNGPRIASQSPPRRPWWKFWA